ncbi:MAG: SulP family inorganic anion transporter [Fluviicola sp.]
MKTIFSNWKQDVPAGLVVFLVAVPLCLGIALASEAPVFSGLIAGIIGGVLVGIFSGSAIGVSGPAAGLAMIVAAAIQDLGSFELFLAAVVLAGVIQILFGIVRMGVISAFFPNSVIKGMLAAIGLLIIFKQVPHAVGYDKDYEGDENFFQADGHNTFSELYYSLDYLTLSAVIIFALSLVILIIWEKKFIQKTFLKFIPGPLVVVLVGILCTLLFEKTSLALALEHRVDLGIDGKKFQDLFTYPDFSQLGNPKLYLAAVTLAVVASVETLLSVDAADKLDPKKRTTNGNRELFAQGIGNIASGLIGGLPVTQVVVRTSANVNSGGISKLSAIVHGVFIAAATLTIPAVFGFVPYASLAAILIMVGYKLAKPKLFQEVLKSSRKEFVIFLTTIIAILLSDLLKGIIIGMALALIIVYIESNQAKRQSFFKKAYKIHKLGNTTEIEFLEQVSFLSKAPLQKILQKMAPNSNVVINLSRTKFLSKDIHELIHDFKNSAPLNNIQLEIKK